jgi:hypothetical protein
VHDFPAIRQRGFSSTDIRKFLQPGSTAASTSEESVITSGSSESAREAPASVNTELRVQSTKPKQLGQRPKRAKRAKRAIKLEYLETYGIKNMNGEAVCILCRKTPSNESLKPKQLNTHVEKVHPTVRKLSEAARKLYFRKKITNYSRSSAQYGRH